MKSRVWRPSTTWTVVYKAPSLSLSLHTQSHLYFSLFFRAGLYTVYIRSYIRVLTFFVGSAILVYMTDPLCELSLFPYFPLCTLMRTFFFVIIGFLSYCFSSLYSLSLSVCISPVIWPRFSTVVLITVSLSIYVSFYHTTHLLLFYAREKSHFIALIHSDNFIL